MTKFELVCSICKKGNNPMTLVQATLTCVPCLEKLTADFQKHSVESVKDMADKLIKEKDIYD